MARDRGYTNTEEMVRDRIVFGVRSSKVQARLIQEGSSLTMEKEIDIGRTMEISESQLRTMTGEGDLVHGIKEWKKSRQRVKNSF